MKKLGVEELSKEEMIQISGGELPHWDYRWSGTDNPLVYAAEAGANGVRAVYNGAAALYNWLAS